MESMLIVDKDRFIGPFKNDEEALEYGTTIFRNGEQWCIRKMEKPVRLWNKKWED